MKYAVIDVGSNSVRLMLWEKGVTLSKSVKITKLAENMSEDFILDSEAVERTALAVSFFVGVLKTEKADKLYIFGTAALRRAKNSDAFINRVQELCGETVEIISGETEAEIGVLGATSGHDGGFIDVGGASTEVVIKRQGKIVYKHSFDVGAVTLFNACKGNREDAEKFLEKKLVGIPNSDKLKFVAVGGTATTLVAVLLELEKYNPEKVDGFFVTRENVKTLTERFYSLSVEERKKLKGLQAERAEVILCGALILLRLTEKLGISGFYASEKDNLEGYLMRREFGL